MLYQHPITYNNYVNTNKSHYFLYFLTTDILKENNDIRKLMLILHNYQY